MRKLIETKKLLSLKRLFSKKYILCVKIFIVIIVAVFCIACGNIVERDFETNDRNIYGESSFAKLLNAVIDDKSKNDGVKYILDENGYNEYDVINYLAVMTEKEESEINTDDVNEFFWNVFTPIKGDNLCYIVKKDNKDLVLGCEDLGKQYKLDCKLMGYVNNEIIKKSNGFYVSQNSPKMREMSYGTSTMARSGCGPIALATAINYASGKTVVDSKQVADWSMENNMYQANAGTKWSLIRIYPSEVGAKCTEHHVTSIDEFNGLLADGGALVTSMGKGHFTENGHFIVITGINDGKVSVLDPSSISRSLVLWDAQLVLDESRKCFWKIER